MGIKPAHVIFLKTCFRCNWTKPNLAQSSKLLDQILEIWPDSEVFLYAEIDDKFLLYSKTSILNTTCPSVRCATKSIPPSPRPSRPDGRTASCTFWDNRWDSCNFISGNGPSLLLYLLGRLYMFYTQIRLKVETKHLLGMEKNKTPLVEIKTRQPAHESWSWPPL